jgi:nucleoside phosphorylase
MQSQISELQTQFQNEFSQTDLRIENYLLAFATEMERDGVFPDGIPQGFDCLISGVGILQTTISLCKAFQNKSYKTAIQIGIAGAYRSSGLNIGDVAEVKSDCLIEFLPWEPNTFFATQTLSELGKTDEKLKEVKGATVLNCTKTEEMGNARGKIAQIETMEGAAFFAACKEYGVKSVQIRAISNYAAIYEKKEWKIEEALLRLNASLKFFYISHL